MVERTATSGETALLAGFNVLLLLIYAGAQTSVSLFVGPDQPALKMVLEPHLLMIGFVLHIQWRKVDRSLRELEITRPCWMAACDCLSFVVTFWASVSLGEAFLRAAKLI